MVLDEFVVLGHSKAIEDAAGQPFRAADEDRGYSAVVFTVGPHGEAAGLSAGGQSDDPAARLWRPP